MAWLYPALRVVILGLGVVQSLSAETVGFPKEHPIFTIEMPKAWRAGFDSNGAMFLRSTEESSIEYCEFSELPSDKVHDQDSARKYLEAILKNCDSPTNVWKEVYKKSLSKSIKGFETLCEKNEVVGLSFSPVGTLYSWTVFSVDGKRYFLMKSLSRGEGGVFGGNWLTLLTIQQSMTASK